MGQKLVNRVRDWGRPPRILGIDLARGIAIIGMMAAHMASLPALEWSEPSTWGGVVVGRSSLLFAFVAGVSLALVSRNPRYHSDIGRARFRLELLGRAMAVFAIGLGCELMNSGIAIILTVYGVLFLCIIPFIWVPTKRLILMAIGLGALGPVLVLVLRNVSLQPSASGLDLFLFNIYTLPAWLTFMLAGLVLGRQNLGSVRVAVTAVLVGILLAVIGYSFGYLGDNKLTEYQASLDTGSASAYESSLDLDMDDFPATDANKSVVTSEVDSGEDDEYTYLTGVRDTFTWSPVWGALVTATDHSGGTMEIIGSGGFVLALVGLCLLIARPLRWLILPIACGGSMPLTTYVVHIAAFTALSAGPGQEFTKGSVEMWAWNVAAILAGATLWALVWGKGPLERLVARAAKAMSKGI